MFHLHGAARPLLYDAVTVCAALRGALQRKFDSKQTGRTSAVFSGHAEGGHRQDQHRHAHYLPLPDACGSRIDRLVVWAPEALGSDEILALAAVRRLWSSDMPEPLHVALAALGNERQLRLDALLGPAECWRSLTPFALPRHPKRRGGKTIDDASDQVRREIAFRDGGVADRLADVVERPSGRWAQFRRNRPGTSHLSAAHTTGVELRFTEPVHGPVSLGALSHFGLGLFTPA